jgi:hypothetical protein
MIELYFSLPNMTNRIDQGWPTRGPHAAHLEHFSGPRDSSHFYKMYLFYNGQSSENQCIKKISPPSSRLEE